MFNTFLYSKIFLLSSYVLIGLSSYLPNSVKDIARASNNGLLSVDHSLYSACSYLYTTSASSISTNNYLFNLVIPSAPWSNQPSKKYFLPVYMNMNPYDPNNVKDVSKVIISIHGLSRRANNTFCHTVMSAINSKHNNKEILVLTPLFPSSPIKGSKFIDPSTENMDSIYWSSSNWMSGANDDTNYTSTYDVLDFLSTFGTNKEIFPFVTELVVSGFSAGAQTVNRYSWASNYALLNPSIFSNIHIRYIVSNPSSYLYVNTIRPGTSCLSKLYNTGIKATCDDFQDVSDSPIASDCPNYNKWKYGIGSFTKTSSYTYLTNFSTITSTAETYTKLYLQKDLVFVFGSEDVCNCNTKSYRNDEKCFQYEPIDACSPEISSDSAGNCCDTMPDSSNNDLSLSCESMLQGSNRLQRGLFYESYLRQVHGGNNTSISFYVDSFAHDSYAFYQSNTMKNIAFA